MGILFLDNRRLYKCYVTIDPIVKQPTKNGCNSCKDVPLRIKFCQEWQRIATTAIGHMSTTKKYYITDDMKTFQYPTNPVFNIKTYNILRNLNLVFSSGKRYIYSTMVPIVTFIGWHDSGKTTLASQVVRHLKQLGYQVAVIKSTKETGIIFDTPGTDTDTHRKAGADSVMLVAPDQMVMMTDNSGQSLTTLAYRYFPEVDIVIGEGFKNARQIAKIEVFRNSEQLLRDQVSGVIAVASDEKISGDYIFRLNEAAEIAAFIKKRFLQDTGKECDHTTLLVNGNRVPIKDFVQNALSGTIHGLVGSLKLGSKDIKTIEIRVNLPQEN